MKLLLLGIIFLSACKALHRDTADSAYELQAVSDNHLTLGAVPVEDEHGNKAYRLLLCKNSITFPKWMFEDRSRCLPALLMPDTEEEALLLPGQISQNFAQKFKGDLKYLAVLSTVTATFCGVALLGSKLVSKNFRLAGHFKKTGDITYKSPAKSKIKYINALKRYKKAQSKGLGHTELRLREQRKLDLDEKTAIYDTALRLEKIKTEQELLQATLSGLDRGDHASVISVFKKKNDEAIVELQRKIDKTDNKGIYAKELNYHQDLNKIADNLPTDRGNINSRLASLSDEQEINMENYRTRLQNRRYGVAGWDVEKIRNSISVSAGHVGSFALLYSINRSIWGYDDRMVSKYWSKIFLLNDDFSQPTVVDSIALILQKLADTFDLAVNVEALKLKDNSSD